RFLCRRCHQADSRLVRWRTNAPLFASAVARAGEFLDLRRTYKSFGHLRQRRARRTVARLSRNLTSRLPRSLFLTESLPDELSDSRRTKSKRLLLSFLIRRY